MAWKPRGRGSAFSDDVMDDEDDRQLLDILGDVDALNDYLHGNNSKSIEEDDVTNAAYGSDTSFFSTDTPVSNSGLKDAVASDFEPLASSLSFMEEELGSPQSPAGGDEPFDILQKSLLEADITEQTLAQEALLDSQPAPTLVQAPVPFPAVAPGNLGGAVGVVTPAGQFIQGVSQLQNGSAQHIQVLGSFGAGGGVMTLSNLERTPQIVLRPPLATPTAAQTPVGGFKNIPLQNIIIQRGPGGTQALVRPIQPKPLHTGAPAVTYTGAPAVTYTGAPAVTYTVANVTNVANGPVVVQSSLEQANAAPGQFLLPGSLALTQNGPSDANANALLTTQNANTLLTTQNANTLITQNANTLITQNANTLITQNAVQIMAGGQLILNQVGGVSNAVPAPSPAPGRLTLVAGQSQVSGSPVQRLLVTQAANCASLSPLTPGAALTPEQVQPRPVPLTRGGMALQQVRSDQGGVLGPPRSRFTSFEDALHRLLPYNVFQGAPPSREQFSQVDEEFEAVAAQVLSKTEAMISKYRKLLFVEAERSSPSSEIVMIDRTFNQEERGGLTQDKRTVLVDPDGFLEEFCCGVRSSLFSAPPPPPAPPPAPPSLADARSPDSSPCPSPRTEPLQPPYSDPGGGGGGGGGGGYGATPPHRHDLKLKLQSSSFSAGHYRSPHAHRDFSSATPPPPPPPQNDTDSALEAAVNSILEC